MRLAFAKKWHEQAKERVSMKVHTTRYKVCIDGYSPVTLELSREFVGEPHENTLAAWAMSCVAKVETAVKAVRIENETGSTVRMWTSGGICASTWLKQHNERVAREYANRVASDFTSNKRA